MMRRIFLAKFLDFLEILRHLSVEAHKTMKKDTTQKNTSIKARNRELVSRIYAGALNPSEYNDMLMAWDKHMLALEESDYQETHQDFDWAEEFISHFEQAGKMVDQLQPVAPLSIEDNIAQIPYAAFACTLGGNIIHANQHAGSLSKGGMPASVFDLPMDTESEKSLRHLLKLSGTDTGLAKKPTAIIRIFLNGDEEPHILMCETLKEKNQNNGNPFTGLVIKSISAVWNNDVEKSLMTAFDLTQAELELVGNLYKGLSIKEIAEWKGRSPATLRTQLSSVLGKTGTKSQSALSRMVVSLVHIIVHRSKRKGEPDLQLVTAKNTHQRRGIIELSNGFILEYVESGDLAGKPFYFIQPSTRPTLTDKIVKGLADNGIRLISPVKPGSGRTTKTPLSFSAKDWAKLHLELIDKLGIKDFSCGGHCAGGSYAAQLARLASERCKSVLMVDVGAPIQSAKTIYQMPSGPRRYILAARFFHKALITPIKYMSVDFNSSHEGQMRAVEYFCEGSPADQRIIHDKELWRYLRDNMGYSMENIPQLVNDSAKWAKDNSAVLVKVSATAPIRYFHGAENLMFHPKHIIKWCAEHENISCKIVPERGQLLVYAEQDLFLNEIITACDMIS